MTEINGFYYDQNNRCTNASGMYYKCLNYTAVIDVAQVITNKWAYAYSCEIGNMSKIGFIFLDEIENTYNTKSEAYNAGMHAVLSYLNCWNKDGRLDSLINCIDPKFNGIENRPVPTIKTDISINQLTLF